MFSLDDLQNRWVLLALLGGLILVLGWVLACLPLWRPRREEGPGPGAAEGGPARGRARGGLPGGFPWFLALTIAGLAVYGIIYVLVHAVSPPNW